MIVSPIKAHIKTRFRLARTPRRLNWRDSHVWTTSQIAARDQELAEWDDSWPAVPYSDATAAPAVPDAKEDRSAEALRTIKALRDEAGLITSFIAPALAERLVLGNGDLTS